MNLPNIKKRALDEIATATDVKLLEKIRIQYLGRKGELTKVLRSLSGKSLTEKQEIGKQANVLKNELDKFETEKASLLDKYEVKVKFCGDFRKLPPNLVNVMKRIMKRTEKYNKKLLNMLIAYGGRFELEQAIKKIAETAIKTGKIQITQKTIKENLLISGDVDDSDFGLEHPEQFLVTVQRKSPKTHEDEATPSDGGVRRQF